jgi:RNA polymerase sigma factor (sigma-70 family)
MLNRQQKVVLPHLCRWIGAPVGGELSDRELLERFLVQRDAAAFAAVVRRHGPTVLGVCRRILNNTHDAEDAFQATFLVLVKKAPSIAKHDALHSWLYGVACRVALKARAALARRRQHEREAAGSNARPVESEETRDDLRPILDEEVNRLPEKYRRPIVLCYFEGKTYEEAARLLGWPPGTASVRLARARALLRDRLAVRGLALSAAAVAAGLAGGTASAAEVSLLAEATAGAAVGFLADPAAPAISSHVIALTEGVVKAMFVRKLKTLAGVFLVIALTGAGAGSLWHLAVTTPAQAADPASAGHDASNGRPPAADQPGPARDGTAADPPRALAPPAADGARPPQTRIGLINMTRVLKRSKKFQVLQADLRAQAGQVRPRLEAYQSQIQKLQAESDDPATSADRRDQNARQIRQLKREMEDEQETAQQKLTKATGDTLVAMYREVEDAANRLAKAQGLELVLFYTDAVTEADFYNPDNLQRKVSKAGALVPMIVAPGMDVTDTVIAALDRAHAPAP